MMPVICPPLIVTTKIYHQTLPNAPWGTKLPLGESNQSRGCKDQQHPLRKSKLWMGVNKNTGQRRIRAVREGHAHRVGSQRKITEHRIHSKWPESKSPKVRVMDRNTWSAW